MAPAGKPFFFVSHATLDNRALRPVLVALLDAGIPLWFDKPYHADIDVPAARFVGYIEPGQNYQVAIDDRAIPGSAGFILLSTPNSKDNQQVYNEVRDALQRKRVVEAAQRQYLILPIFLGPEGLSCLHADLKNCQGTKAFVADTADGWVLTDEGREQLDLLILVARRQLADCETSPLPGLAAPRGARAMEADPYLVDRAEQRSEAIERIKACAAVAPQRAPLFAIYGNSHDEPTQVGQATFPCRVLSALPNKTSEASRGAKRLEWPPNSIKPTDTAAFNRALERSLGEAFPSGIRGGVGTGDTRQAIAERIAAEGIVRLVYAEIASDRPRLQSFSDLKKHLRAWCAFWDAFPFDRIMKDGVPLLTPVVAVTLVEPGRHKVMDKGKSRSACKAQEARDAGLYRKLSARNPLGDVARGLAQIDLVLLPKLELITPTDVTNWVHGDATSFPTLQSDKNAADALQDSLVDVFANATGLPMKEWARKARAPLRKFSEDNR